MHRLAGDIRGEDIGARSGYIDGGQPVVRELCERAILIDSRHGDNRRRAVVAWVVSRDIVIITNTISATVARGSDDQDVLVGKVGVELLLNGTERWPAKAQVDDFGAIFHGSSNREDNVRDVSVFGRPHVPERVEYAVGRNLSCGCDTVDSLTIVRGGSD